MESFILANEGKGLVGKCDLKDHIKNLIDKKKEIVEWTYEKIVSKIEESRNRSRLDRFKTWNWELKTLPLNTMGVYPTMCELPKEYCLGTVPESACLIKRLLEGEEYLQPNYDLIDEATRRILKLRKMFNMMHKANQDDIDKYLQLIPLILVKGETIRGTKDRKLKGYGVYGWDIDDGSSRAIIISMIGRDEILAYAGRATF
jgi:hypothetical protein